MPSTVNRALSVPATGTEIGVWGQNDLNPNFAAIDTIVGGVTTVNTTGGVTILNAVQAASGTILVTGTLTSNAIIVFPAVQGWWTIQNYTLGAFIVQATTAGAPVEAIGLPPGALTDIQINTNTVRFRNIQAVGTYLDVASATVPTWISGCTIPPFLNCNGGTFSAATYPFLFRFLGNSNQLPDFRGNLPAYLNQATGRITSAVSGVDGDTYGATGSTQSRTLTQGQLPVTTPVFTGAAGTVNVTLNTNVPTPFFAANYGSGGSGALGFSATAAPTSTGTFTPSGTIAPFGNGDAVSIIPPITMSGLRLIRAQ